MTGQQTGPHTGLHADVTVEGRLHASLHAGPGRVVAVIGPNGAGKSTLLGALAGTVRATGRVEVAGRDWSDLPVRERRLGVVFQDRSLLPHLRARDDVAFGLRARGVPRREADQRALGWLERLGVGELADRRPAQLSGGQAQRVAIARALAGEPDLLLLDEPFAGLDVGVATGLRIELARHLAAYAGIALLVTHDALDALTLADEVLVLDEGRVVQTGTPREVAARPRSEHVARLVGLNVVREGDELRSFAPSAVAVSPRARSGHDAPATSARHRWAGRVAAVAPHGDAVRLLVSTEEGPELIADVTPASAVELGLEPGAEVWLSVKATAVQTDSMRP